MLESESETNGLTMKLLGLARYCEGPKTVEIQSVINKLPVAAYNERTAAEDEIARLRRENAALKHRLARCEIAIPSNGHRHPASAPRESGYSATRSEGPRDDRARPGEYIKQELPQTSSSRNGLTDGRLSISSSSSATLARNPRLTPPSHSHELFPMPSAKRQRTDSVITTRRRPVCTGCFQVGGLCDGKVECDVCHARSYGCEYRECWDGLTCTDMNCTRIHPDQWDPAREPGRKVNQSRNGGGSRR